MFEIRICLKSELFFCFFNFRHMQHISIAVAWHNTLRLKSRQKYSDFRQITKNPMCENKINFSCLKSTLAWISDTQLLNIRYCFNFGKSIIFEFEWYNKPSKVIFWPIKLSTISSVSPKLDRNPWIMHFYENQARVCDTILIS